MSNRLWDAPGGGFRVGFEIEGIALVVLAGVALAAKAGVSAGVGLKAALLIGAVLIQACLPLIGHTAMLRALRWLAFPFIVLFVIMAIITAGKVNLTAVPHGAGWGSVMVALALVISAGGLGWMGNANDYSRYLPPATSKRNIVAGLLCGGTTYYLLARKKVRAEARAAPEIGAVQS
jgi:purine-cytosine permease-like protein